MAGTIARSIGLAALLACFALAAMADPGYYVVTAYDEAGVRSLDLRYWTVKFGGSPVRTWPEVGLSYGVNHRWTTALLLSYIGDSASPTTLSSFNWQNDYLLTQGQYPVDVAVHTQLIHENNAGSAHTLEWGPALQTDIGRTQLNANLFFEQRFGGDTHKPTLMKYQWQIRHRWMPALHLGLQGFGEVGTWDDWSPHRRQSHRTGPALFSNVELAPGQMLKIQGAYLMGKIYGRQGSMFSMRAALSF